MITVIMLYIVETPYLIIIKNKKTLKFNIFFILILF